MPLRIIKTAGTAIVELGHKAWLYPDGTPGIRLDASNLGYIYLTHPTGARATIHACIQSMNDVMELLLVTDALRALDPGTPIRLYCPFFPFAQQDRRCCPGEALSIKVMADLINAQGYDRVTVVDLHSDVSAALIHRIHHITQAQVIGQYRELSNYVAAHRAILVAPDAGSNKKVSEIAKYYGHTSFVRCDKRRNLATGEIVETLVYATAEEIRGNTYLLADDICIGGASFTAIAKILKERGAARVGLYTSHGIYSKGTTPLRRDGIDDLFTTDSTFMVQPAGVGATVLKLEELFKVI